MLMEIWKDIEGVNNEYEVSNLGRVRSKEKEVEMYWIKGSPIRIKKSKILAQTKKDGRYKVVTMYVNKHIQRYIHRLVAQAFIGEIKEGYNVNHKDKNIDNNNVENLEIITYRSNSIHANLKNNKSSKYIGVYYNKARGKWVAMARNPKGKKFYLGGYDVEEDARDAYVKYIKNNTKDTVYI
jgi:hypothetical protein